MTDATNRRNLLKAAATGAAVVATAPAFAQQAQPEAALVNPATKYTSTPFAEQPQKWPALQRDMRPVPDCG